MSGLNIEVFGQFARRGLEIGEGIAVHVRLVKSAKRSLSNDEFKGERDGIQRQKVGADRNCILIELY